MDAGYILYAALGLVVSVGSLALSVVAILWYSIDIVRQNV